LPARRPDAHEQLAHRRHEPHRHSPRPTRQPEFGQSCPLRLG
jgi:hypothetical protein